MASHCRLSVLAFFLSAAAPTFGAGLSLLPKTGTPGSSVIAPIALAVEEARISAIQFDLEYDDSSLTVGLVTGDSPRAAGKQVYSANTGAGTKRFLVAGLNSQSMTSGVLVNLFLSVSTTAQQGTYPLKLSGVICVDADGLPLSVSAADGQITVQGSAAGRVPLQPDGVLNGASLLPGPLSPGELISLLGARIGPADPAEAPAGESALELNGTRVFVNGAPAPLLYAAADQINAIVPYSIAGSSSATLLIQSGGEQWQMNLTVAEASPALFAVDSSGSGQGVILNDDFTLNSPENPAARDSIVSLFVTGGGDLTPRPQDGATPGGELSRPVLAVVPEIGGTGALPISAGAAAGLPGVIQVTCRVPDVNPGPAVPVAVRAGSFRTPDGVTLAIK